MTPERFEGLVDEWAAGVKVEALALFRLGVPAPHAVKIAIQIYDVKTLAQRQETAAHTPQLFVPRRN